MNAISITAAEAARTHAAHRAWERHGLAIALPDLHAAEKRIWVGRAKWLEDQISRRGNLRQAFQTKLKGRLVVVVFDIHIEAIVTVLPNAAKVGMETKGRRARNLKRARQLA